MRQNRMAGSCLLFNGESLPPAAGDAGGESGGRYEVDAGYLYPAF